MGKYLNVAPGEEESSFLPFLGFFLGTQEVWSYTKKKGGLTYLLLNVRYAPNTDQVSQMYDLDFIILPYKTKNSEDPRS